MKIFKVSIDVVKTHTFDIPATDWHAAIDAAGEMSDEMGLETSFSWRVADENGTPLELFDDGTSQPIK